MLFLFFYLLEVIVHAGAKQTETVAVLRPGDDEVAVVEIDIEIFDLGAPVLRQTDFGTETHRPPGIGMALAETEGLAGQLAEGETRSAIKQDIAEGVTGPATDRAEPRVGEFPRRECVGGAGTLEVTFDADSIRSFATLAGDHNPLHHDPDYASRSRFGGLIASSTQYGALLMGMVGTHLTRGTMALGADFSLRFRKAVHAGQTLRLEWTITAVEPKPALGGDFVRTQGRMVDAGGITYLTASATCLVIPEATDQAPAGSALPS